MKLPLPGAFLSPPPEPVRPSSSCLSPTQLSCSTYRDRFMYPLLVSFLYQPGSFSRAGAVSVPPCTFFQGTLPWTQAGLQQIARERARWESAELAGGPLTAHGGNLEASGFQQRNSFLIQLIPSAGEECGGRWLPLQWLCCLPVRERGGAQGPCILLARPGCGWLMRRLPSLAWGFHLTRMLGSSFSLFPGRRNRAGEPVCSEWGTGGDLRARVLLLGSVGV